MFALAAAVLVFCGKSETTRAEVTPTTNPVKILFVGNSSTYYNNMPLMVKGLADADEQNVEIKSITASNYKLYQFADSTNTYGAQVYSALKNNKWDYVVLQDHREMIIGNLAKSETALSKLAPEIKNSGAKLVLYETQSDYQGRSFAGDGFTYFLSNGEMRYYMTKGYFTLGNKYDALVCTAGTNFARCMEMYPEIDLYGKDNIHPTANGSYMTACLIYQTIFDTTSYNNEFIPGSKYDTSNLLVSVKEEDAIKLQSIADGRLKLNKNYIEVKKGESATLLSTLINTEENTILDTFANTTQWSSLSDHIVSINKKTGIFNALSVGDALIMASTDSGLVSMCTVSVKQPSATFLIAEAKTKEIHKGDTFKYTPTLTPSDTTDKITWKSSNSSVATVSDDGTILAKDIGTSTITATTTSGIVCKRYIRVKLVSPKKVKVSKLSTKAKSKKYANVKIKWKKNSKAAKYIIYRRAKGVTKYKQIKSTTSTSYVDKNKKKGVTYYYKVKSVYSNTKCNSDRSASVKLKLK